MTRKKALRPAVAEFAGVDLGDARLDARVLQFVEAMAKNPAAGFPSSVGTTAEREANYRLLNNRRVDLKSLLAAHVRETCARVQAQPGRPLVIIDGTEFVFKGESERKELERRGAARQGFNSFFALAVSEEREPLGVLSIVPSDQIGGASATDWAGIIEAAAKHIGEAKPIYVIDREADAYELFATQMAAGRDFVIRVSRDRMVKEHDGAEKEFLRELVGRTPLRLSREVKLSRRSKVGKAPDARRRHPPREGRNATLSVRSTSVSIPRPRKLLARITPSLKLNVVQVLEENPPEGEEPVEWALFTTLPVDSAAAVARVVDAYRARWTIEEYFKVLKSGCSYEKRQLESRHALLNALGILAPIAWRLLALRTAGDQNVSARALLDEDELVVLRKLSHDVKLGRAPTAAEAILAIAMLGGHFKQNGRPGWKVIWTGFQKVLDAVTGYRLAMKKM